MLTSFWVSWSPCLVWTRCWLAETLFKAQILPWLLVAQIILALVLQMDSFLGAAQEAVTPGSHHMQQQALIAPQNHATDGTVNMLCASCTAAGNSNMLDALASTHALYQAACTCSNNSQMLRDVL